MSKPRLYLDFDGTIVDSYKAFCKVYNESYFEIEGFVEADYRKVEKYNLSCQCPLLKEGEIHDIFDSELFFKYVDFLKDAYDVIRKASKFYDIYIVTIGSHKNLQLKVSWLKKNLPFVKNYVLLLNDGCAMDKSVVNMGQKGSVFIDDIESNLTSTNAEMKICFGKIYEWNKDWTGINAYDWKDVESSIM